MSFMESYKKLDNLCKDLLSSNTGVTSYINEMDACDYTAKNIPNWQLDYKQLKHYRHIRNKIAHETNATEKNMCKKADEKWVEFFYKKIINQKDPLSLYRKNKAKKKHNIKSSNINFKKVIFVFILFVCLLLLGYIMLNK